MKILITSLLVCVVWCAPLKAQEDELRTLKVSGYWQGGDLYIQNPYSMRFRGFCAMKVYVNDQLYTPNANSSAIVVKLKDKGHTFNEFLEVEVMHHGDCRPRFVNKDILAPRQVDTNATKFTPPEVESSGPMKIYEYEYGEEEPPEDGVKMGPADGEEE